MTEDSCDQCAYDRAHGQISIHYHPASRGGGGAGGGVGYAASTAAGASGSGDMRAKYTNLLQDFFDTLHGLYHAHSCSPGDVEWKWDETQGKAVVTNDTFGSKAKHLADRIYELTGAWPLPCGVCNAFLRNREIMNRRPDV